MAINPSTNGTMSGRVTASDVNYPYASSKNESTPGAGDGTPYFKARADDIFGMQQAILRAAQIVPTGNADTALVSQYLQGIVQQAQGRAILFDDSGAADAYVVELRTDQQAPGAVFDGQRFRLVPDNTNTGASTLDVSALLGQAAGTTIINIKLKGGSTDPAAGLIISGDEIGFVYRTAPSVHAQVESGFTEADLTKLNSLGSQSVKINQKLMDIGTYDMEGVSGASKTVAHGLTAAKIKTIAVSILSDLSVLYDINHGGYAVVGGADIVIYRDSSGAFDTADFDGAQNRGSILINYID
jgi:hypothetical protein